LIPDLPGFGNSPMLKKPFTISAVATALIEWLESLKIENAVLIGHSLGGYVALAMAKQRPTLFNGIGLFHSTAEADSPEKKENRTRVIDFVSKNGSRAFIDSFVPALFHRKDIPSIDFIRAICAKATEDSIIGYSEAMRERHDSLSFLKEFKNPIFFLAGEFDTFISPQNLIEQSELASNGHFYEIPASGHMAMFENDFEAKRIVLKFLRACF
jgi:pimeloyl-ACP methyl ester carboxylesterase